MVCWRCFALGSFLNTFLKDGKKWTLVKSTRKKAIVLVEFKRKA